MPAEQDQQLRAEPGPLRAGESLDDLHLGGLRIIQPRRGYRFSLDPILLCAFARIGRGATVCDLGTGSGVIPLILARRSPARHVYGLEIQAAAADRAQRSVQLNGLAGRVTIMAGDLRRVRSLLAAECCQVVVANPPYRRPGSGRQAAGDERAAARHELHGGLDDFLAAAAYLLGSGGRCTIIYLAERLAELLAAMQRYGLEPKRLRCVHSRLHEPARLVLVEGRRGGAPGIRVEPPLGIYQGADYSPEVQAIYASP